MKIVLEDDFAGCRHYRISNRNISANIYEYYYSDISSHYTGQVLSPYSKCVNFNGCSNLNTAISMCINLIHSVTKQYVDDAMEFDVERLCKESVLKRLAVEFNYEG